MRGGKTPKVQAQEVERVLPVQPKDAVTAVDVTLAERRWGPSRQSVFVRWDRDHSKGTASFSGNGSSLGKWRANLEITVAPSTTETYRSWLRRVPCTVVTVEAKLEYAKYAPKGNSSSPEQALETITSALGDTVAKAARELKGKEPPLIPGHAYTARELMERSGRGDGDWIGNSNEVEMYWGPPTVTTVMDRRNPERVGTSRWTPSGTLMARARAVIVRRRRPTVHGMHQHIAMLVAGLS